VTIPAGGAQPNLLAEAVRSLPKYFTPATASTQAAAMRTASLHNPNYRIIGGGVSAVTFAHIAIANPTAVLQADVTAWWRTQSRDSASQAWHVVAHHAAMQYTATLERVSAHWMVRLMVANCLSDCS
jgi:hypothetical protein